MLDAWIIEQIKEEELKETTEQGIYLEIEQTDTPPKENEEIHEEIVIEL